MAQRSASATRRPPRGGAHRAAPKVCRFCHDGAQWVDYTDVSLLRRFMGERGKIRARHTTGTCAPHQREVAMAIKTCRELALLPYAERTVTDRQRGSRSGGSRSPRRSESAPTAGGSNEPAPSVTDAVDAGAPAPEEDL